MLTDDSSIVDPRSNEHFLLLYHDEVARDEKVIKFLNEGLKRNQLCIHASVKKNEKTMSRLSSGITDYETNHSKGNLIVTDLSSLYKAGLKRDLRQFDDFVNAIIFDTQSRLDRYIRIVGDCSSVMVQNKYLEESITCEEWWQKKPFKGSVICTMPSSLFNENSFMNYQEAYRHCHDKVLVC